MSRLRHIYQQATLRYGSHARAIFSISFGLGSLRFLYYLRMATCTP